LGIQIFSHFFFFLCEIGLAQNCTSIGEVQLTNTSCCKRRSQGTRQRFRSPLFLPLSPTSRWEQVEYFRDQRLCTRKETHSDKLEEPFMTLLEVLIRRSVLRKATWCITNLSHKVKKTKLPQKPPLLFCENSSARILGGNFSVSRHHNRKFKVSHGNKKFCQFSQPNTVKKSDFYLVQNGLVANVCIK